MDTISWSRSIKIVAHGPAAQMFCLGLYGALKISEPAFKIGRFHIKKIIWISAFSLKIQTS